MAEITRIGIKAADSTCAAMLTEGGRMMAAKLPEALPSLLEKAAERLFAFSEEASTNTETRSALLLLQGELRQRSAALAAGLREALLTEFNKAVTPAPPVLEKGKEKFDISALSLVDFDTMDESMVLINLTSGLRNGCAIELRQLNSRTARLLGARDFVDADNPFGPEVVASAFKTTFSSVGTPKTRLTLLHLVEQIFPPDLAAFYGELNAYFSSRGVVGEGKFSVKKSISPPGPVMGVAGVQGAAPGPADGGYPQGGDGAYPQGGEGAYPQGGGAYVQGGGYAPGGAFDAGDLFGSLQQLIMLNMSRGGMPGIVGAPGGGGYPSFGPAAGGGLPSAGAAAGGGGFPFLGSGGGGTFMPILPPMATGELLQSLTHLQRGDIAALPIAPGALPAGFETQQLAAGSVNVLRNIRDAGLYNASSQVDAITIDVVAMLFDFVFDDKHIPAAVRVLIGRLQIPVLKAAMLDKKFFSKKDNPARNLLDRLAQVSVAWREDVGEDDPLYRRIAAVVHDVIDNFEEDVSVFDRAVEQLDQYIAEEQQKAEEHAQTAAEALYQREVAEFAQIMAREEIVKRAGKVPPEIQQFLLRYWLDVLAKIYEKDGEASEAWRNSLQVVDDLAWSIEPKYHSADRLRLVRTLPQLLRHLEGAMRAKSADDGEIKAFSAKLVEFHIAALKAQPSQEKAAEQPAEPVPAAEIVPASEVLAAQEQDLAAADASAEKIIPAAPPAPASDEGVVETLAWTLPTKDLTAEDEHDKIAKGLKKGCWVEFALDDGTSLRSKLTWISPMKGVMLFADRDGSNAVKISPKSLAKRFRNGTASVLGDASLVERAVTNVMGQLMKNAGPEAVPQAQPA